jgi:hypothetical protein
LKESLDLYSGVFAYICGAASGDDPISIKRNLLMLQEVLAAITCVRGMKLGGYYPGGQILVGPDGTIYGDLPNVPPQ